MYKQAVGVDRRVRKVADFGVGVSGVGTCCTHRSAVFANGEASAFTCTRTSDFFVLDGGTVGQEVVGLGNGERFVELSIEYPLLLFIERVTGAENIAGCFVVFCAALISFCNLIVQAPLAVIGQGAVEHEGVFQTEAFAGHVVCATTSTVHVRWITVYENAADDAFLINVAFVIVLFIGEGEAVIVVVIPARLGQYVGGFNVFRVSRCAGQTCAAVIAIRFSFMAIAPTHMQ